MRRRIKAENVYIVYVYVHPLPNKHRIVDIPEAYEEYTLKKFIFNLYTFSRFLIHSIILFSNIIGFGYLVTKLEFQELKMSIACLDIFRESRRIIKIAFPSFLAIHA